MESVPDLAFRWLAGFRVWEIPWIPASDPIMTAELFRLNQACDKIVYTVNDDFRTFKAGF
jgi:hypothetical protein